MSDYSKHLRHLQSIIGPVRLALTFAMLAFASNYALAAETSEMVAFQGFFRDALGDPLVAPFNLTLTIYDADTNGNVVAGPYVLNAVLPIDGAVAVEFGPVPVAAVPAGESRYLGKSPVTPLPI